MSGAGAGFGMGGPFTFPQSKISGSCTLTSVANASGAVQAAYNQWKSSFVTSNGAGGFLRVQRDSANQNDTVSEGIGYGMLAAVYMGDEPTFDGLFCYARSHFDAKGLMNWHLTSGGAIASGGAGSATDGDEDMIWSLLMASDQWSNGGANCAGTNVNYLAAAKTMIDAMFFGQNFGPDGLIGDGDGSGTPSMTHPDYFSPAYFRVFQRASGDDFTQIIDKGYTVLAQVSGNNGLVPDTTNEQYALLGNYGYDACRTPWRIAMDYCFNNEPRAKTYLMKIGPFFSGVGAANIGDGYAPSGSQTSGNKNMAFIGPAGVAGMAGYQTLLDGAFNFGANNPGGGNAAYFPQSLRVVTMLMMSGNFLDYTKLTP